MQSSSLRSSPTTVLAVLLLAFMPLPSFAGGLRCPGSGANAPLNCKYSVSIAILLDASDPNITASAAIALQIEQYLHSRDVLSEVKLGIIQYGNQAAQGGGSPPVRVNTWPTSDRTAIAGALSSGALWSDATGRRTDLGISFASQCVLRPQPGATCYGLTPPVVTGESIDPLRGILLFASGPPSGTCALGSGTCQFNTETAAAASAAAAANITVFGVGAGNATRSDLLYVPTEQLYVDRNATTAVVTCELIEWIVASQQLVCQQQDPYCPNGDPRDPNGDCYCPDGSIMPPSTVCLCPDGSPMPDFGPCPPPGMGSSSTPPSPPPSHTATPSRTATSTTPTRIPTRLTRTPTRSPTRTASKSRTASPTAVRTRTATLRRL